MLGLYSRNQRHQMRNISKHVSSLFAGDKCKLSKGNNRKQENRKNPYHYHYVSMFLQCIPSGIFLGKARAVDYLLCCWHVLFTG